MAEIKYIKHVNLVCVGSELFYHVSNTNIHTATRILEMHDFCLNYNVIVPDDLEKIIKSVKFCMDNGDAIIISGGLGPTFDDITREAVSELTGKNLSFSESAWEDIKERFRTRGIENIPEKNRKQAMMLEGATKLTNTIGTAPGMMVEYKDRVIFLLPGVPKEFEEMLQFQVIPELLRRKNDRVSKSFVRMGFGIVGEPEAVVEEKTDKLRKEIESQGGIWTILALPYLIELWLKIPQSKKNVFCDVEEQLKEIFGVSFLGTGSSISIPESLFNLLKEKNLTCCFAESCTGGLAGHLITEIPGSSEIFNGSIVAYSNKLKKKLLKVPKTILRKYGAVSEQTAIAMAKGARKYGKSDVSLAITGIAGPQGGSIEKPVGLVYMAVALSNTRVVSKKLQLSGQRSIIKMRAALAGMDLLRRTVLEGKT
ncbi:MAG TPA: CinA family nicotinamide mononucleotide deamidase-related protein [bacterium]|nr:CinA family nicotinamide mononucleotide deamidase-related protein [bacterium]